MEESGNACSILRFDIRHRGRLSDRILGLSHQHDWCQELDLVGRSTPARRSAFRHLDAPAANRPVETRFLGLKKKRPSRGADRRFCVFLLSQCRPGQNCPWVAALTRGSWRNLFFPRIKLYHAPRTRFCSVTNTDSGKRDDAVIEGSGLSATRATGPPGQRSDAA